MGVVGDVENGLASADDLVGIDDELLEVVASLRESAQGVVGRGVFECGERIGGAELTDGLLGDAVAEVVGLLEVVACGIFEESYRVIDLGGERWGIGDRHGEGVGELDTEIYRHEKSRSVGAHH